MLKQLIAQDSEHFFVILFVQVKNIGMEGYKPEALVTCLCFYIYYIYITMVT